MSTVENGNTVTVHYTGTLNDGTEFDSSRGRESFSFQIGAGQVIPGFNDEVVGMTIGETKNFKIPAENAYGEVNEAAIQVVEKDRFAEGVTVAIGETVSGQTGDGQQVAARIVGVEEGTVTLDFNHPLAGQDLNFEIELLAVSE